MEGHLKLWLQFLQEGLEFCTVCTQCLSLSRPINQYLQIISQRIQLAIKKGLPIIKLDNVVLSFTQYSKLLLGNLS